MLFFKACPKCHGDMFLDRDLHGVYHHCYQCGLMLDVPTRADKSLVVAQKAGDRTAA